MSYNPAEINISTRQIAIDELLSNICFLNLSSSWSLQQKSSLIESILIRIPIQFFYVSSIESYDLWQIVDGKERLLSIKEFCQDKAFRLQRLEYLTDLEGRYFDEIERPYQRRLLSTYLTVHLIEKGTSLENYHSICARLGKT